MGRLRGPALVAAAVLALHALCGSRYGIFRDELYFLVCGQRLAPGYVDQPPLVALVARLAATFAGTSVAGLRLLPWLAAGGTALLSGALALRLGGSRWAALLAATAVASAPLLAVLGHYLTMNAFEPLLAVALVLVLARVAAGDSPRLLAAAGLLAGLATLNKYTGAMFAACLLAGLLATPERRVLRSRWALAGAALALLAVLPNLAWQAAHGLPFLELVRNGQLSKNVPFSLQAFAQEQLLAPNPLAAPLWLGGLGWLVLGSRATATRQARHDQARGHPWRFAGLGVLAFLALLVATGAKGYYAALVFPILFAAGAVGAEQFLRHRLARVAVPVALVVSALPAMPLVLPLLAPEARVRYQAALGFAPKAIERKEMGALPQLDADQFGWEELAGGVGAAWGRLSPSEQATAVVFAQNYGEAAAVELYGPAAGLPRGVAVSGHNQFFLWGVPPGRGAVALVISDEEEDCGPYARREHAGALPSSPWAMPYERGLHLWICREPRAPLATFWPSVKHYE